MCAFEIFLKSLSRGRSWETQKIKPLREKTFLWHHFWCHRADLTFEGGIKIDATRLKPAFVLAFWRQNGAKPRRSLASGAKTEPISCETSSHHPTATFEPPKRHLFSKFLETILERPICSYRECLYLLDLSIPLQQHGGQKNDTGFQNISLLNYRSLHPSKNDIGFLLFLWGSLQ